MCAQFIQSALGDKGGGVQLVCDCTYGLAWEVIFDGRKDKYEGRTTAREDDAAAVV